MPAPQRRVGPPADGEGGSSFVRKFLSLLVVASCLGCFVGCLFLVDDIINNPSKDSEGRPVKQKSTIEVIVGVTTYGFYMLLSLVLFLVEWEPLWVFNYALILHYWPGRGIFHIFLGAQLIHSASVMNAVEVFGLDGDKVRLAVQIFGWTFFGTGCIYFLLGVCQMRGADGRDVVKKVRKGGSYQQAQKIPPSKTASGQVSLLYKLRSEGVPHLEEAIQELENLIAEEEADSGISGWFRKKFGKEKKEKKGEKQQAKAQPQPPGEFTGVTTHGGSDMYGTEPPQAASAPPQPDRCTYGTDPNPMRRSHEIDDEDDIKKRREREDEALEREYMRRQQMYQ
eukprot:TRINITY_DN6350_c1_g2_i2.p1 TRINITY_DN6350_c1_g2~~TRINITY_DN6350_c1_g2_i2.p1  ORF type:complete len:360 (+),score=78.20 TRINITY_DN6350_c1_g2_i2:65-1081(+)